MGGEWVEFSVSLAKRIDSLTETIRELAERVAALEKRHAEDDAELAKTAGVDHG